MKMIKTLVLFIMLSFVPITANSEEPSEIKKLVENRIEVVKSEISLIKQKIKSYGNETYKTELVKKQEEFSTLKNELKIANQLVKVDRKLKKCTIEKQKLETEYTTLMKQGNAIFLKEKNNISE